MSTLHSCLTAYYAPVTDLPGVGRRRLAPLCRLLRTAQSDTPRLLDLLFHLPTRYHDRRIVPSALMVKSGDVCSVRLTVQRHEPPRGRGKRGPWRVWCRSKSTHVLVTFFSYRGDWPRRRFPEGAQLIVSGRCERHQGVLQFVHPDYVLPTEQSAQIPQIDPVYPATHGLGSALVARLIAQALDRVPALPEWLDPNMVERRGWPDFRTSLKFLHQPDCGMHPPESRDRAAPESEVEKPDFNWRKAAIRARERLAFDELLARQLGLSLWNQAARAPRPERVPDTTGLAVRALKALPWPLTGCQTAAFAQVRKDMSGPHCMLRLLHGDVGSGKTVVAWLAMLLALDRGDQAVLMAPTELLARQHSRVLAEMARPLGIAVQCLTGSTGAGERRAILTGLRSGHLRIVVGTHALIQPQVSFHRLGIVVVDEQHRFGVRQRVALVGKAGPSDTLLMSATPIPRTLVMAAFGDMDTSQLREKPAGRKPIHTRVLSMRSMDELVQRLQRALERGEKVYWICPQVAQSEEGIGAATARAADLQRRLPRRVGLVHGQMAPAERDKRMDAFRCGDVQVLVATTVVEVGVDVPAATIMIIENADRFGMAQLHQLRGRVGRGGRQSYCVLLHGGNLSAEAVRRMQTLRETEDGFRIAEADLRLRGGGDVLGVRQSGDLEFAIADPAHHAHLLSAARDTARSWVGAGPLHESSRRNRSEVLIQIFLREAVLELNLEN